MMQAVTQELSITTPNAVVTSGSTTVKQLLALSYEVADEAMMRFAWPELVKTHSVTLVASQAGYALPKDFNTIMSETMWNDTDQWFVEGPISPQEWRARQKGIVTASVRDKYRIFGLNVQADTGGINDVLDSSFNIYPTPDTGDAGKVISFEYQSTEWIRPPLWVTGTAYSLGDYVIYASTIYKCTGAGTSNNTSPTTDTGATWTSSGLAPYVTWLTDSDVSLLHERSVMGLGLKWMWKASKGLPYQLEQSRWEDQIRRRYVAKNGAKTLSMAQLGRGTRFLNRNNIPDGGYG